MLVALTAIIGPGGSDIRFSTSINGVDPDGKLTFYWKMVQRSPALVDLAENHPTLDAAAWGWAGRRLPGETRKGLAMQPYRMQG